MVDDKYEPDFDSIMAKVKSVTGQQIKYILSTHHHADHSGGNTRLHAPTLSSTNSPMRRRIWFPRG
jgi:glyoxylase-like metal-dependent hydrolase (beta-lactamase superfamily II)